VIPDPNQPARDRTYNLSRGLYIPYLIIDLFSVPNRLGTLSPTCLSLPVPMSLVPASKPPTWGVISSLRSRGQPQTTRKRAWTSRYLPPPPHRFLLGAENFFFHITDCPYPPGVRCPPIKLSPLPSDFSSPLEKILNCMFLVDLSKRCPPPPGGQPPSQYQFLGR